MDTCCMTRTIYLSVLSISSLGLICMQPVLSLLGVLIDPVLLVNVFGLGHVAISSYFLVDKDYRVGLVHMWPWLLIVPVPIALFILSPIVATVLYAAFLSWQFIHVTKQSYGLIAFSNFGVVQTKRTTNLMLNLVAIAGVLGILSVMANYPIGYVAIIPIEVRVFFQIAAFIVYIITVPLLVYTLYKNKGGFSKTLTITGWSIFIGPALSGSIVGFAMCGLTHAIQYWMLVITSAWQADKYRAIIWSIGIFIMITPVFYLMSTNVLLQKVFLGLFALHFVMDANLWHLSNKQQRDICMSRFGFLLKARSI